MSKIIIEFKSVVNKDGNMRKASDKDASYIIAPLIDILKNWENKKELLTEDNYIPDTFNINVLKPKKRKKEVLITL